MTDWLKQMRGLPSVQSYNMLEDTKSALANSSHLADDAIMDKMITRSSNLKTNMEELKTVFHDTNALKNANDALEWLR